LGTLAHDVSADPNRRGTEGEDVLGGIAQAGQTFAFRLHVTHIVSEVAMATLRW
jgi:hypothetical protein